MSPFFIFFKTLYFSSFKKNSKEKIAIDDLFNKDSYRVSSKDSKNIRIVFTLLKKSIKLVLKKSKQNYFLGDTVYYLGSFKSKEITQDYLDFLNKKNNEFIYRNKLEPSLRLIDRLYFLLNISIVFLLIFTMSFFVKNRSNISLVILELTELYLLDKYILNNKLKKLIIFDAYEKDIYFLSYYLKKSRGMHITLIPSSNPIKIYYKNVIADTFIFTAPFQKEEYELLKNNWDVKNFELWPPFGCNKINLNTNLNKKRKFSIGLISSGMLLREKLFHKNHFNGDDILLEKSILKFLSNYINKKNIKLLIYLHPLEKKHLDSSKNIYSKYFLKNYFFAPIEKESKDCFDLCDIAVSGFSSAQVERLYGGYKSIYVNFGNMTNLFSDTSINGLVANNNDELNKLIVGIKNCSDNEFFDNFKLNNYRWDYFLK